jgi:hypothetical protein
MLYPDFQEAVRRQRQGSTIRQAILFRIDYPGEPLRMWMSVGDYMMGVTDLIEASEDAVFRGIGHLIDVPVVQQLLNGTADRVDFTLSGTVVTADVVSQAMIEGGALEFCRANLGVQILGADWQPIAPAAWLWEGEVGPVSSSRSGGRENPTRSIGLSIGSGFTARRRPGITHFTDPHQQRFSPGDLACDKVGRYSVGSTIKWP